MHISTVNGTGFVLQILNWPFWASPRHVKASGLLSQGAGQGSGSGGLSLGPRAGSLSSGGSQPFLSAVRLPYNVWRCSPHTFPLVLFPSRVGGTRSSSPSRAEGRSLPGRPPDACGPGCAHPAPDGGPRTECSAERMLLRRVLTGLA